MNWQEKLKARQGAFRQALTHASYVNEGHTHTSNNERLEFLGDAVVGLCISRLLYDRFPDRPEGDLTRFRASLVAGEALARHAAGLELGPMVRLGRGELLSGGRDRPSLLANVFEAVVGALYLEEGVEAVFSFIAEEFAQDLAALEVGAPIDAKTRLQEFLQKLGAAVTYRLDEASGPPHRPLFRVSALVSGEIYGMGQGYSKKEAEQQAAAQALDCALSKLKDAQDAADPPDHH